MPLFSRPRSPAEIVRNLKEALNTLERGGDSKKQEKVRKNSSDLITYFVSQSRNLRKNSSSNGGTEDEETRKIRFFRQVWSCYIFFVILSKLQRQEKLLQKDTLDLIT